MQFYLISDPEHPPFHYSRLCCWEDGGVDLVSPGHLTHFEATAREAGHKRQYSHLLARATWAFFHALYPWTLLHSVEVIREKRGTSVIAGSPMSYKSKLECACGWRRDVNEPPSSKATKNAVKSHIHHEWGKAADPPLKKMKGRSGSRPSMSLFDEGGDG